MTLFLFGLAGLLLCPTKDYLCGGPVLGLNNLLPSVNIYKLMKKRLYKSETDKKLDGVCAGIAEYFDVDPTLIRAGYVFLTILSGVFLGVIAYIALAIIMPKKSEVKNDG